MARSPDRCRLQILKGVAVPGVTSAARIVRHPARRGGWLVALAFELPQTITGAVMSIHIVRVILCGVCLLCAANVAAQPPRSPDEPTRFQLGVGLLGAGAVGDFGTGVDGAWGALVHMDVGLGESPFSLGGEFAGMGYGAESRSVYIGNLVPDIPNLSVKVNTDHEMWLGHMRVRAQRRVGRWRPYADGLVGFTELATRTSIKGALSCSSIPQAGVTCSSETAAEATNAKDYVPSYGGAAGIMIGFRSSPRSPRLDLSVRYHRGGVAEYLTKGAIVRDGDRVTLNVSRSRTDMVMVYCGLTVGR